MEYIQHNESWRPLEPGESALRLSKQDTQEFRAWMKEHDITLHDLLDATILTPLTLRQKLNLTNREVEVLTWLHKGLNEKEIGLELHTSYYTIKSHTARIRAKCGVRSLQELMCVTLGGLVRNHGDFRKVLVDSITEKEKQVMQLIVDRCSDEKIRETMKLPEGTLRMYRANLRLKLGVHSDADLIVASLRFGLTQVVSAQTKDVPADRPPSAAGS